MQAYYLMERSRKTLRWHSWAVFFFFSGSTIFLKNWNIIVLWCCVSVCYTTTWISHMYTYIPSLSTPPPQPSRSSQSPELSSLHYIAASHLLSVLCMAVYMSVLLSQFIPHSHSPTVSTSPFPMSVSLPLPCKQAHQYHVSRFQAVSHQLLRRWPYQCEQSVMLRTRQWSCNSGKSKLPCTLLSGPHSFPSLPALWGGNH